MPPDDASPRKSAALSAARNAVNVQVLMRLVRIDNQMKSGKVPPCPSGFATAFGEQKQREPRCTADLTGAAAKRPASPGRIYFTDPDLCKPYRAQNSYCLGAEGRSPKPSSITGTPICCTGVSRARNAVRARPKRGCRSFRLRSDRSVVCPEPANRFRRRTRPAGPNGLN